METRCCTACVRTKYFQKIQDRLLLKQQLLLQYAQKRPLQPLLQQPLPRPRLLLQQLPLKQRLLLQRLLLQYPRQFPQILRAVGVE